MKVATNWQLNERRAARRLGLEHTPPRDVQVRGLDVELSDGHRIVLQITKWGLSIEMYKDSSKGRPLWSLSGSTLVEMTDLFDFSRTLARATGVLAPSANSSKRPLTASKNDEKTGSEKVAKKAKEITV